MDLSNPEQKQYLQQGLSMIFTRASNLIGLKDPISNINKLDIVEMILSRYKGLSLEEIDYAFRLDRYSGESVSHYQLFNAEYVGKVLHKYRVWLRTTRANNNLPLSQRKKPVELTEEEKQITVINGIVDCFEEFKVSKEIPVGRTWVYDYLYDKKLLPAHTSIFREKIRRNAIKQLHNEKNHVEKDGRKIRAILREIQAGKKELKVRCKVLVLKEYFSRLIAQEKEITDQL